MIDTKELEAIRCVKSFDAWREAHKADEVEKEPIDEMRKWFTAGFAAAGAPPVPPIQPIGIPVGTLRSLGFEVDASIPDHAQVWKGATKVIATGTPVESIASAKAPFAKQNAQITIVGTVEWLTKNEAK